MAENINVFSISIKVVLQDFCYSGDSKTWYVINSNEYTLEEGSEGLILPSHLHL